MVNMCTMLNIEKHGVSLYKHNDCLFLIKKLLVLERSTSSYSQCQLNYIFLKILIDLIHEISKKILEAKKDHLSFVHNRLVLQFIITFSQYWLFLLCCFLLATISKSDAYHRLEI